VNPEEAMFKEALSAVSIRDFARARDLLTRLLRLDSQNAEYWLWMSACVETSKERSYCLKEARKIDPNHPAIKRGLQMMGELPPASAPEIPFDQQIRNWNTPRLQKVLPEEGSSAGKLWLKLLLAGGGMTLALGLLLLGILGPENSPLAFMFAPRPTPTLRRVPTLEPFTITPTSPISTPAAGQPTPLEALLSATYTPTPYYVSTPHSVSEAFRTGLRAFQRGEWISARNYFNQVATLEPDAMDLPYLSAETYRMAADTEMAITGYEKIIAVNPNFAPAYLGRARVFLMLKPPQVDKAYRDLQRAAQLDALMFESYLELARLELLRADPQASLLWLEEVDKYNPDNVQALELRARAHLAMNETEQAVEFARQANQANIISLPGYLLLGEALMANGSPDEALAPLETYTRHAAQDGQGWVSLAKAYQLAGEQQKALSALSRLAVDEKPTFDILLQRGLLYLDLDQPENAIKDLEQARVINKKTVAGNIALGRAYLAAGRAGNAYQSLSEAEGFVKSDADQAQVYYWRAQSLDELGETKVALREWRALLNLPKDAVPAAWRSAAEERIAQTITPTPTKPTPTVTPTATARP
jgi:tetratricopeptide (TPR) repeat protein